jgi:hemerythrin
LIEWKEEYTTGIKEIDKHHQKIIGIANKAFQLMDDSDAANRDNAIAWAIFDLIEYTLHQFYIEEEYMLSINHRDLFWHKMEHEKFVKNINTIKEKDAKNKPEKYLMDFLEFYSKWLDSHTLDHDKRIVITD